jgi:hypothetical protein
VFAAPGAPLQQRVGPDGMFDVSGRTGIGVMVLAPWPGRLNLTFNGTVLEETALESPPKDRGWFKIGLTPGLVGRDVTRYELLVRFPPGAGAEGSSPLGVLSVVHRSLNRECNRETDAVSLPLLIPLKLRSPGAPAAGAAAVGATGTPAAPTTGTELVDFFADSGADDPLSWSAPHTLPKSLEGAKITSVRNVSETSPDPNHNLERTMSVPLDVTLTDRLGANLGPVRIEPGQAKADFNGMEVLGQYKARAVDINAAFLTDTLGEPDARIMLDVSWRKP